MRVASFLPTLAVLAGFFLPATPAADPAKKVCRESLDPLDRLNVGDFGPYRHRLHVVQIAPGGRAYCGVDAASINAVVELDTTGLVDGRTVTLTGEHTYLWVIGTHTYTTIGGGSRTVLHARVVNDPKETERRRKILETTPVRAWVAGRKTWEGKFLRYDPDKKHIHITLQSGKEFLLPGYSAEDLAYVEKELERRARPAD